ncbi:MAG: flagellar biosynthesis protein FlhB [Candidatus Micropelagos sp.]|uniref:Flagellar biosynthetic protein FlhB n=1 Tax=PS1 clade bacterium TaxID=2175152 RepID=A0A368EMH7_9PROT|nr:flagellar biosynthesis protein FlhB [Hyphomicrobiales bacterium]OUV47211.1 MAG: flagellar biosynthesis protein FlhB [Alphaproteobacteria bacterium TMED110]RCL85269.1 MAG: flagellar biosynthesis protein FlhB [PS1 clade bacterium]
MAENNSDDAQEKTEEPTQRRIDKAKEDGQILTSKEVFVFANISMGLLVMLVTISYGGSGLSSWSTLFRLDTVDKLDDLIASKLMDSLWLLFQSSMLVGVPIVIVNLLTQAAVGGLNFAPKAMKFKGNRINPISGLKRMFSMKALVELGKSILKVVLLFGIATAIMFQIMPGVLNFPSLTLPKMLEVMRYVIPLLIGALLVVLAIIAAIDYFWQRYTHIKQLRMSRQDLKDEFKQTEGSPEVKAKIRRMQAETATRGAQQREALDDVANATAVITNPTHFAVALRYEVGDQAAPVILAMGRGIIAQQIIERAETAQVSVFRSPILARALYFSGDIGAEISQSLYNAVAVVLAYLYRLEKGEALQLPDVDVPEDMQFNEFGKLLSEDT